jgi:hypothetical protein
MEECTSPQYIVRNGPSDQFDIEEYAIKPGAQPALIVEVPEGSRTIPSGNDQEIISRVAKMLSDRGLCTLPANAETVAEQPVQAADVAAEVPSQFAALAANARARTQEAQSVEEVPSSPDVYTQKTEAVNSNQGGAAIAGVIGIPLLIFGGKMLVSQVQQRMFTEAINPEVKNYETEQAGDIYQHPQPAAAVSAVPAHEPSPWARPVVHAGNPYQQGDFDRNDSSKWGRNGIEMARNESEMTPEMTFISTEMDNPDSEQLDRVRSRLSGIFRNTGTLTAQPISTEMTSETKSISGYFDPSGDLTKAREVYFSLRQQGLSAATDLGGAIFGIRGGDKWASVSPILREWSNEWENIQNGQRNS